MLLLAPALSAETFFAECLDTSVPAFERRGSWRSLEVAERVYGPIRLSLRSGKTLDLQ